MEGDCVRRGAVDAFVTLCCDRDIVRAGCDVAKGEEHAAAVDGLVGVGIVNRFGAIVDEADRGEAIERLCDSGLHRERDLAVRGDDEYLARAFRCRWVADRLGRHCANGRGVDRDCSVVLGGS